MTASVRSGRGVDGKPGRRYELTDDGWDRILDLIPKQARGGRWREHRVVLNGMFWVLNSGAQWRDMPDRYGKWETVYGRYRRWAREGLFERILTRLHARSTSMDASTGASSMSMDQACARIGPLREPRKKEARRARRPRLGAIARRLWHEASSCDARLRRSARYARHGRTVARIEVLRSADGHGPNRAASTTRCRRRRPCVQLSENPELAAWAMHRGCDPDTIEPAPRTTEQAEVPTPQCGRALHRLAQGVPTCRDPI